MYYSLAVENEMPKGNSEKLLWPLIEGILVSQLSAEENYTLLGGLACVSN